MKNESLDHFHQAFEQLAKTLPGAELPWLRAARRSAFEQFDALGFPTTRHEDWKYTNVSAIGKRPWHFAPQRTGCIDDGDVRRIVDELVLDPAGHRLVFVNGRHVSRLSKLIGLPHDVFVGSLTRALREMTTTTAGGDRLADVCRRLYRTQHGVSERMDLPSCYRLARSSHQPLHMLFLTDEAGLAVQPFNVVLAGARSGCVIVEHFVGLGDDAYWTNAVTRIVVDEQADRAALPVAAGRHEGVSYRVGRCCAATRQLFYLACVRFRRRVVAHGH